jgi:hypothetical protein
MRSAYARLLLCAGWLLGCNTPDATFGAARDGGVQAGGSGGAGGPDAAGGGAGGAAGCRTSEDCATDPAGPVCDGAEGVCVGCLDNADCGGALTCDTVLGKCAGCATDDACPAGTLCELEIATCVPGCNDGRPCAGGLSCCDVACVDTATSSMHCGGCDRACPGAGRCAQGVCSGNSDCPAPFEDCDGKAVNGCEANLTTSGERCGDCWTSCTTGEYCKNGTCAACPGGRRDCDRNGLNGCESDLGTDPSNCGGCGRICSLPNAEIYTCSGGTCQVETCRSGFGNCDGEHQNGCELDTRFDKTHCGQCNYTCLPGQACSNAICSGGEQTCDPGFVTCGNKPCGCVGDGCCGNDCQIRHDVGLAAAGPGGRPVHWYDCVPYGTYDRDQAMKACTAYASANGQPASKCTNNETSCLSAQILYTTGKGAGWAYGGAVAGRVMDCLCCATSSTGPMWDP